MNALSTATADLERPRSKPQPTQKKKQQPEFDQARLNFYTRQAKEQLRAAFVDGDFGPAAMVSSFGSDSVVLLHLLSEVKPDAPVLMIDTEMLFPETLQYQLDISEKFGLSNVQRIKPDQARLAEVDPDDTLHQREPDLCCHIRKTETLEVALAPYSVWINGRKRYQAGTREDLPSIESDREGRIKLTPLAEWDRELLNAYRKAHDLPTHPLVAQGYKSIGCAPCTQPVSAGQDERAGRWAGQDKTECGIHFADGKIVRVPK